MNIEQALGKWFEYNERIKEIQQNAKPIYDDIKKLKNKKHIIENKLQNIIPNNNSKTYTIDNYRLKPIIVFQQTAITKTHVEDTIRHFFGGNEKDANRLLKMIYEDRTKKEKCTIRCTTIKSKQNKIK